MTYFKIVLTETRHPEAPRRTAVVRATAREYQAAVQRFASDRGLSTLAVNAKIVKEF